MLCLGKQFVSFTGRGARFNLYNLSDIHFGAAACDVGRLKADVAAIATDPYALWLATGDVCDFVRPNDKRWDPATLDKSIPAHALANLGKYLYERMASMLKPISDKCLGVGEGNHEHTYQIATDQGDLTRWLTTELNVPFLGYSSMFDLVFCRLGRQAAPTISDTRPANADTGHTVSMRVFTHHGAGAAQTPGGKIATLVRMMDSFEADLYLLGHVHDQAAKRITALAADGSCKKLVSRERLGVVAGSYLRTYQTDTCGYGERRGYRPTTLGAAVVEIEPENRVFRARV